MEADNICKMTATGPQVAWGSGTIIVMGVLKAIQQLH